MLEIIISSKYEYISYMRNDNNIGPINNFVKSISLVTTKYLHLLGDDDLLDEKYFEYFPAVIKTSNYGVIYLNSYGYDFDSIDEKPYCIDKGFVYLNSFEEFFMICMQNVTFISAFILNTKSAQSSLIFKYYSEINFSNIVYSVAKKHKSNLFLKDYIVAAKRNNAYVPLFQQLFLSDFLNVIDNQIDEINIKNINLFKLKYGFGYLPMYIYRERVEYPERREMLINNINNLNINSLVLKIILLKIVTLNLIMVKPYVYLLAFVGKIYLNGFVDTLMKLFKKFRSKVKNWIMLKI